jgi:integrase/recombinase XerC/integrase/recombinase XerD
MLQVQAPKRDKCILPSLTEEQVEHLVTNVGNLRDECIIRLLFDSGIRLSELTNIQRGDIDWETNTITVIGKGNKQHRAPFTERTAKLLQIYLHSNGHPNGNLWGINQSGIHKVLRTLSLHTGIKCNPHAFRQGFACNLHRRGLSTLDIMHLGGWADLSMVLRYTRSITFDDCLKHYQEIDHS